MAAPSDDSQGRGDRLAGVALGVLLVGGAGALVATVLWGVLTGTSPTLDEKDRVHGWSAVLRSIPAALLAWTVPLVAMVLAVHACRRGSRSLGYTVIKVAGLVLFVVSISVIGGAVDAAAPANAPTIKWVLMPLSVVLAVGCTRRALVAARPTGR